MQYFSGWQRGDGSGRLGAIFWWMAAW